MDPDTVRKNQTRVRFLDPSMGPVNEERKTKKITDGVYTDALPSNAELPVAMSALRPITSALPPGAESRVKTYWHLHCLPRNIKQSLDHSGGT